MNYSLTRFAWLSIGAAVLTISLKTLAYFLTGSVGLLSDALESVVNLFAAVMALVVLTIAIRPPDEEHAYGYTKVEYFSSGLEGALIVIAALLIAYTAIPRLIEPQPIEQVGIGLAVSILASTVNLVVARVLLSAGKRYNSITLEADAKHLMTDVWTSVAVVVGVAAVAITGIERLDPIIALVVAANIVWTGFRLLRRSAMGLVDTALPSADVDQIKAILSRLQEQGVQYHALRTRQAGARSFVSFHVLVPGNWSVQRGHQLLERIEGEIRAGVPHLTVFTHLEPNNDPASWEDTTLDRPSQVNASTEQHQQGGN